MTGNPTIMEKNIIKDNDYLDIFGINEENKC